MSHFNPMTGRPGKCNRCTKGYYNGKCRQCLQAMSKEYDIAKLKKDAEHHRTIANKLKADGFMDSFRINIRYSHGIEYAIECLERENKP